MTNEPRPLRGYRDLAPIVTASPTVATGAPYDAPITAPADNQARTFARIRKQAKTDPRSSAVIVEMANDVGSAKITIAEYDDFVSGRTPALPLDFAQQLVEVLFDNIRLTEDCLLQSHVGAGVNLNKVPIATGRVQEPIFEPHAPELPTPAPVASRHRVKIASPVFERHEAVGVVNALRLVHEQISMRALRQALRQNIDWDVSTSVSASGYEGERITTLVNILFDNNQIRRIPKSETTATELMVEVISLDWTLRFT